MFVPNEPTTTTPTNEPVSSPQSDLRPAPPLDQVFLLSRDNRRYLDLHTRRVHLHPNTIPAYIKWFIAFVLALMLIIEVVGIHNFASWLLTHISGRTMQGNVIEKHISSGKSMTYSVVYAYTVDGQNYMHTQQVDAPVYIQIVKTVEVTYWPPNPNFARLSGPYEFSAMGFNSALVFFMPVVVVLIMIVIFLSSFKGWRMLRTKQQHLRTTGHLIYGEVESSEAIDHSQRGYEVIVRYSFHTPDARHMTRKQSRIMNWLRGQPLPAKGTPVAVLYTDDHFEML